MSDHGRTGQAAVARALLVALCFFVSAVPAATAQNVFTIRDVPVDVTAATAAEAREQAVIQGQRAAFRRLMARLVPRESQGQVPKIDTATLTELVRDFEVEGEKTSAVRYLASLTIRFKPDGVRSLLQSANIAYAETMSRPVLILPLYRAAGTLQLWDKGNLWASAWRSLPVSDGLVPLIVPPGELADVRDMGPEQALHGDSKSVEAMTKRYKATGAVLALATLSTDPASNQPQVDVSLTRYGTLLANQTVVRSFPGREGETVAALLTKAAEAMVAEIEGSWKRDNLLRFGEQRSIVVTVPLKRIDDWVDLRKRLRQVAFVRQSRLLSLSRQAAMIRLDYLGDSEQLMLALAQRDLSLTQGVVSWVLTRSNASDETRGTGPAR